MGLHTDALVPFFAGALLGLTLCDRPRAALATAQVPGALMQARVLDPDAMCARDLRRLPRIGPARAIAIVRTRFEDGLTGGPEAWNAIPGIGPETVRAVRVELEREEARRLSSPRTGAYTPRGSRP